MSFRYQVVTIFGGSGFIGRHLIRRFSREGAVVRVVSRHPGLASFTKLSGAVGQIAPISADLTNDESVARAIHGSDVVINLVGTMHPRGKWDFKTVHVDGAARIARIARAEGVRHLVHLSALGAKSLSNSVYARTKAEGEDAVLEAFPDATILRPSIVFGPEDRFFNKFAAMAQLAPALPLIGGGATRFQPVYVGDVAEAVHAAVVREDTRGQTYELGGPRTYSFKELLEITLSAIRRQRLLLPLPWSAAATLGGVLGCIPLITPALTRDQVELLRDDNVVSGNTGTFADLGITELSSVEVVVPTYLSRFVVGGYSNPGITKLPTHNGN